MAAPYLLVGNGRLSRHLQHYFDLEAIPWRRWDRRSEVPLAEVVGDARAVLVLISDDAIEGFVERHAHPDGPPWVHCSGSVVTPRASGVHPLMTFSDELYDRETYRRIPFVCGRGGVPFATLFSDLPNPHFVVDAELMPLYHALCTMAGNFTTLLWSKAFADFERRLELPREVLYPYLERVAANLTDVSAPLTGPLARGDQKTIDRHLKTLDEDPYGEVYRAFVAAHGTELRRRER
jgi:predicted short-subunit dehydrogenase-like oxidoreductase (DUF2520 family)